MHQSARAHATRRNATQLVRNAADRDAKSQMIVKSARFVVALNDATHATATLTYHYTLLHVRSADVTGPLSPSDTSPPLRNSYCIYIHHQH